MDIIYLILKGIIIGIIVSAPMGPVGLLCLKETLQNGKKDGFMTGLGASISDTLYGIISYFSIGIVLSFIESHQVSVTILGSLLLFIVGYYLYVSTPQELDSDEQKEITSLHGAKKVITAFVVTLSNPLILFFFLSLYSRFYFVPQQEDINLWIFILSVLSVFSGCMLWWYTLTHYVSKIRNKFKWKYLKGFNKFLAILIVVISVYGIISSVINFMNGMPL